jgi:hypothetical protein
MTGSPGRRLPQIAGLGRLSGISGAVIEGVLDWALRAKPGDQSTSEFLCVQQVGLGDSRIVLTRQYTPPRTASSTVVIRSLVDGTVMVEVDSEVADCALVKAPATAGIAATLPKARTETIGRSASGERLAKRMKIGPDWSSRCEVIGNPPSFQVPPRWKTPRQT